MTLVNTNSVDRSTGFSFRPIVWRSAPPVAGIAIVVTLWWLAGLIFRNSPTLRRVSRLYSRPDFRCVRPACGVG